MADQVQALEERLFNFMHLVAREKQRVEALSHELLEAEEGSFERERISDLIAQLEFDVQTLQDEISEILKQIEQLDATGV